MKRKLFIITLMLIALMFIIGCKEADIQKDILNVSITQSEIPSEGQAFFKGYMMNPTETIYNNIERDR